MRNKYNKLATMAVGLLGSALMAQANSITLTETSATGTGPSTWLYTASFINSTLNNGDFFTIYDFGSVTSDTAPAGWVMSQALLGSTPSKVIPTDDPGKLNVTFTWGGGLTVVSGSPSITITEGFTLVSPLSSASATLGNYTSIDQASSGANVGQDSQVIGPITLPVAPLTTVPDGGTTVALLGFGLMGLAGLRRKLA